MNSSYDRNFLNNTFTNPELFSPRLQLSLPIKHYPNHERFRQNKCWSSQLALCPGTVCSFGDSYSDLIYNHPEKIRLGGNCNSSLPHTFPVDYNSKFTKRTFYVYKETSLQKHLQEDIQNRDG